MSDHPNAHVAAWDKAFKRQGEIIYRQQLEKRFMSPSEVAEMRELDKEMESLQNMIDLENRRRTESGGRPGIRPDVGGTRFDTPTGLTYRPDGEHSYWVDLIASQLRQDFAAMDRLRRHATEVTTEFSTRAARGGVEYRDLSRTDGAGGQFVPPIWLIDEYVEYARAGRVTADRLRRQSLPPGTDSINVPKIATGTTTEIQTADNAAVSETDATDAVITAPVRTIAGQQDVAIQLLEQSPVSFDQVIFSDLLSDYSAKLDVQVLKGTGASGQMTGLLTTSGILDVDYTDPSPTVAELWPKLNKTVSDMSSQRFLPPEVIVMHPRRWAWVNAALDTAGRPIVVPTSNGPVNAVAVSRGLDPEQSVGVMAGLPVYVDANIPTTLGGGTEDVILVLRGSDVMLWESDIKTRVLPEPLSGTLTVRLQLYGYCAMAVRNAKGIATVTDTGLAAPTF
jgi:HK97 family phage major capsid protein